MLHTLLLTAAFLTASFLAATPQAPSRASRPEAARNLRSSIAAASETAEFSTWLTVARATVESLGPGDFSASLEHTIRAARRVAATDERRAADLLLRELRTAADDLDFTPLLEAELPAGFPEPTPVREIELKLYPKYRFARVEMQASGSSSAFWKLFTHIQRRDIPMTAPVEMTYGSDNESWDETGMSFLYASPAVGRPGPAGSVRVADARSGWALSIGCRGRMNRKSLDAARARLSTWIENQVQLEVAGPLRSMGYNSPMVPASRQYFELQVPMRWKAQTAEETVLIDFGEANANQRWVPIHDSVMGGVSTGRIAATQQGTCVFEGTVSLANNGGFASVRTLPADWGLDGAQTLRLTFRGDGHTYKLRLGTDDTAQGVHYELPFETTADTWQTHVFTLTEFAPVWRGRPVRDAGPLATANVRTIGLMISDEQVGPFRIELAGLFRD